MSTVFCFGVHIPGPHMLQHSPSFSYWVRGSHCGWPAISVCTVNTESHVTSYSQGSVVAEPLVQFLYSFTCNSRGHDGKSPQKSRLLTGKFYYRLILHFRPLFYFIFFIVYFSIATVICTNQDWVQLVCVVSPQTRVSLSVTIRK